MLPGDRLVCAFVEPQATGTQIPQWLLHVTIVPWFRLGEATGQIAAGLSKALGTTGSFEVAAGETVMFGPKKNRSARLVGPTGPFEEIEQKVRIYLHKKRAWLVDETTKRPRQFRPHVTVQGSQGLGARQTFEVNKLYIVEQKGNYKEIVAEISLG
ncbi:MAG TPA: 2'-5' RNA ligase family protein [Candidatus Saccharimonadales bacterium]|nr:2'-5' RNA ligase family protein [Candidatus Saccharimonadales bacterium]